MPMPRDEFRKMSGYNDFTAYSGFRLLGRGGSGSVYEVIRNGTRYAMKIPLQFSPNDDRTVGPVSEATREGFLREADSLNSLSNKCSDSVVTMEDYGTVPFPWIVMEFAEEDLRSAIDKGAVNIHDMIDILRGLDRIHSSGYRHLDIKPENIMRVGAVWKFTDFGLSNPINSVSVSLSKNEFAGTIQYSAPEQVSGKKYGTKDHRTDIWQMAVVIYEFLAKRRPYDSDDLPEVCMMIMDGGPDLHHVPERYRSVLSKALQTDKESRYQRAMEFADALKACTNNGIHADDIDRTVPESILNKKQTVEKKEGFFSRLRHGKQQMESGQPSSESDSDRRDGSNAREKDPSSVPADIPEDKKKTYMKAIKGNAKAQFDIGKMYYDGYYNGYNKEQSDDEALKWFRKAAEQGHADAQYYIGRMCEEGRGVEQSEDQAMKWYKKAGKQGYYLANIRINELKSQNEITDEIAVPAEIPSSKKQKYIDAVNGDILAQYDIGLMYENLKDVEQSHIKAAEWIRKAAEQEYPHAELYLGWMYEEGRGVEQSYTEARKWYTRALDHGYESARKQISELNRRQNASVQSSSESHNDSQRNNGDNEITNEIAIPSEIPSSMKQKYIDAINGDAVAQYDIGLMYGIGNDVEQSYPKALEWITKAAEHGNASAQNYLGWMYEQGRGVKQSDTKALIWYTRAANHGYESAKIKVSELKRRQNTSVQSSTEYYSNSQGNYDLDDETTEVPILDKVPDSIKGVYERAVNGDVDAQYHLGVMYDYGQGVEQSEVMALRWYKKAASNGNVSAKNRLDELKKPR